VPRERISQPSGWLRPASTLSAGDKRVQYPDIPDRRDVIVTDEDMEAAEEDELITESPEWQIEQTLSHVKDSSPLISLRCLISSTSMSTRSWKIFVFGVTT
jgi:hypothetical protein